MPGKLTLYDPKDHRSHRKLIFDGVKDTFRNQFPLERGNLRVDLEELDYADPEEYSLEKQREAVFNDKYLARRLRGTLSLKDKETNQEMDRKSITFMRVPYLTDRGTFIHGGNEYVSAAQPRLLPGPYTRKKNTGQIETQFNIRRGTGPSFRVLFDPESSQFRFTLGQSNFHLYSLLNLLGVPDEEMENRWGPDVFKANKAKQDPRILGKAYHKLIRSFEQNPDASNEEKVQQLRDVLSSYELHKRVTSKNLPDFEKSASTQLPGFPEVNKVINRMESKRLNTTAEDEEDYVKPGLAGILSSTNKLLEVSRGHVDPDDRDNLQFKRIHRTADMLKERTALDADKLRRSFLRRLSHTKSLKHLHPFYFDGYMEGQLIGNPLSSPLEETNPLQLVDQWHRMTMMGPGGIGDPNAITESAQAVHPSTFGFISTLSGPESERAGLDVRAAFNTRYGSDGKIYQQFLDKRDGKVKWMSAEDLDGLTMKLPD